MTQVDWTTLARTQFIQLSLAIVLGGVIAFAVRRRPHVAYVVWIAVLVKAVTPPVWSSPVGLFSWAAATSVQSAATASAPAEALPNARAQPPMQSPGTVSTASVEQATERAVGQLSSAPISSRAQRPVSPLRSTDRRTIVLAIWLAGAMAAIAVPLAKLRRFRKGIEHDARVP